MCFSKILIYFRTLFSRYVSVCTHSRQVEHQRCSRTCWVQKNQKILRKNTIFNEHPVLLSRGICPHYILLRFSAMENVVEISAWYLRHARQFPRSFSLLSKCLFTLKRLGRTKKEAIISIFEYDNISYASCRSSIIYVRYVDLEYTYSLSQYR